jgi:hypothetical protein
MYAGFARIKEQPSARKFPIRFSIALLEMSASDKVLNPGSPSRGAEDAALSLEL